MAAKGLSAYARAVFEDDAVWLPKLTFPLLVWEAPPSESGEVLLLSTHSGIPQVRPHAADPLVFEVIKGTAKGNAFAMGITVGRTDANDISLDDNSVSRFHAYFQRDARTGVWKLVDAESKNGTFVGTDRLAPNKGQAVKSGQRLAFGDVVVRFLEPADFLAYLRKKAD